MMYPSEIQQFKVFQFESIDSTNTYALKKLTEIKTPFLVIANQQTKGYGRRKRDYISPKENGLYLTLAFPGEDKIDDLLTLKIAVALSNTLKQLVPEKITLKWVNDLIYDGKKVAGILAEKNSAGIVLGIGINLLEDKRTKEFGHLFEEINNETKTIIIEDLMRNFSDLKDSQIIPEYLRFSNLLNKKIELKVGDQKITGVVTGFTNQGHIILNDKNSYSSGEVVKVLNYEK